MTTTPHVLVAGGGIGGLCLAHSLRRAGIDVTVLERTHARIDWLQGYRIHISPQGSQALHDCLAPAAWQRFLAAVAHQPEGGMSIYTERLRRLAEFDTGPPDTEPSRAHHGISRIALREALLDGLDDVVRFGAAFERYTVGDDGRVRVRCADGSEVVGDLLVGADGANSRVRGQLLPGVGRIDTGVTAIAGKYRLTEAGREQLPAGLVGVGMVLPADHGFLFLAAWLADRQAPQAPPGTGLLLDPSASYLFWAYADAAQRLPEPGGATSQALRHAVSTRIAGWHPALRHLVAASDPTTVDGFTVRSAQPVRPWRSGPVTLLGDAIHNMTPMAGIGANTALRDADLLGRRLIEVRDGRDLVGAVHDYEREMLDYGFAAVRASLRNARMAASDSRLLRAGMRGGLRLAGALRRRTPATDRADSMV